MKLLTAVGNPILKEELENKGYNIINKDIQYKEGIKEFLEENHADCIILYENLEGEGDITELIIGIKENIKNIIVILETDKLINFLRNKNILYINKKNIRSINNIIEYIKKIKIIKKYRLEKNKYIQIKKKKIKINKKKKKYNVEKTKIIGIVNLSNIEKSNIEKLIKNKHIIKIFIKEIGEKIDLEINEEKINIKNIKDFINIIFCIRIKKRFEKKIIIIFIDKEEYLKKIKILKYIDKIIWVIESNIDSICLNKQKIEKYKKNKKIDILLISKWFRGIDYNIVKEVFGNYNFINKIKIGVKNNGIRK